MIKRHAKDHAINEFIVNYVNTTHGTHYTAISDEVFDKFFNSDVFYECDNENMVNVFRISKLSYEAMQYLLKNIVDTYFMYLVNQSTYSDTMLVNEVTVNKVSDRVNEVTIDNISVRNFNYIINKIVEWTISSKTFKEFVNETRDDRKFNKNLLQFVITSIGHSLFHTRYILYVVYKYAEAMEYYSIIYLYDTNIMWNRGGFDIHYKELINKRFGKELFTLSNDLNAHFTTTDIVQPQRSIFCHYGNSDYEDNDIIGTLLTKLDDKSLFNEEDTNNKIITILDESYRNNLLTLNRYILLFNYLVLSNRINDIKTMLLSLNIEKCLTQKISTYGIMYTYNEDINSYINYLKMYNWRNIDTKLFITIEIYRSLLYLDISNEIMEKLISIFTSINIDVHNNYYDNNDVCKLRPYSIKEERTHFNIIRYKLLQCMIEYIKCTRKNNKNINEVCEKLMSLADLVAITK